MAIRPKAVLTALNQRPHNGVLRAAGTDAAVKLLRSMSLRDGLIGELRERLHEMSDTGEIVIECEGNRFDLIATPEALESTPDDTKDGDQSMIAPAGQRKTTYARDGQGHELPAHLGPQHVGPLTVTYRDPKAGDAIAAAAELVLEEVVASGKCRHGREEFLATIQAILLPLYDDKAEVASALATPVLCYLVDNGHAKRVPVPGQRGKTIIEIVLPEPTEVKEPQPAAAAQNFDPIEVLSRLAPELEAARLRITELTELAESAVSPDVVARLAEKAEGLQTENEGLRRQLNESGTEKDELQRKLDAAAAEKEKILTGQRQRLARVRADHESALAQLRKEQERALVAIRRELEAALSENTSLKEAAAQRQTLPADLQRRVEKLLAD